MKHWTDDESRWLLEHAGGLAPGRCDWAGLAREFQRVFGGARNGQALRRRLLRMREAADAQAAGAVSNGKGKEPMDAYEDAYEDENLEAGVDCVRATWVEAEDAEDSEAEDAELDAQIAQMQALASQLQAACEEEQARVDELLQANAALEFEATAAAFQEELQGFFADD